VIAALPMYDHPRQQAANDAFWAAVRDRLRDAGITAPEALHRGGDIRSQWLRPDLLLGQTCSLPFRRLLHDKVHYVASADYGLPNVKGGFYRSVIIARANDTRTTPRDFATATFAYNSNDSQSGWAAALDWARHNSVLLDPALETGGHRASALAVAQGNADLASIDAVTYRTLQQFEPFTENLRIIAHTDITPGLPFITALANDPETIRAAMLSALNGLDVSTRATLGIAGFADIGLSVLLNGD
jgi:ABC-type phosphate/phosphonate transport system substrate-binding protein